MLEKTGSHAQNKQSSLLNFPHSLIFYTTPQLQGRFLFFFLEDIETGLGSQSLEPTKWEDFNELFILLIYLCFSVSTWTRMILSISPDLQWNSNEAACYVSVFAGSLPAAPGSVLGSGVHKGN